jgi:hypothetical protein
MQHNRLVSSACGEFLLRLTKPRMARMLALIRRGGEDGDCRVQVLQDFSCNFSFLGGFFCNCAWVRVFLEDSRCIRVCGLCNVAVLF